MTFSLSTFTLDIDGQIDSFTTPAITIDRIPLDVGAGVNVNQIAVRNGIEGTPRGAWLKQHTPLGRFGNADELAGAALYLISPAASYTTGETIIVDGGFLTRGV